jgi:hypothetical protein
MAGGSTAKPSPAASMISTTDRPGTALRTGSR